MTVSGRHWFWIGIGLAVIAAGVVAALAPVREWESALEESLERMGLLKGLVAFGAIYIVGSLLLVPAWIFAVAAGAVFGMGWGLLGAIVSSTLAAIAAFGIARYVLRDRVERAAKRNETFAAVDKAVRRDPWKVVALLRMSPVMPSGLKSYFLGLTSVKPLDYASATAAGMLPGLALKVYLGYAGRDLLAVGGATKWAMLAIGLAATVVMATVVSRFARRRLSL